MGDTLILVVMKIEILEGGFSHLIKTHRRRTLTQLVWLAVHSVSSLLAASDSHPVPVGDVFAYLELHKQMHYDSWVHFMTGS